jgi:Predicted Zn-dependent protease (DUF2268)
MKNIIKFTFIVFISLTTRAQTVIHTADITNFWQAYDSIQTTNDKEKQIMFLQKYYIDKSSEGLKYTTKVTYNDGDKPFTAKDWVQTIFENNEKFQRIRPFTLKNLENQKQILKEKFKYLKETLYPEFKGVDVYFVMGMGVFGGRADGHNLIIGSEIMATDTPDWAISIVLHEFVHTIQTVRNDVLLQHCIMEGTADFVAEIVNQKSLTETYPGGYIDFGNKNEKAVWDEFKKYIHSSEIDGKYFDWIYGSKGREVNGVQIKDLGYFMGYTICRSYYKNAKDKKQALREIIEWDLSTPEKAREFLIKSGYVPKKDLKFIQSFKFKPVIEVEKEIKKELYGYKLTNNEVVFIYKLGKLEDEKTISKITVAGVFNGWNPNDDNYKMILKENRIFELHLPKSKFEKEKTYMFKFVVNGTNWLGVPEKASNVDADSGNLTLRVN